VNNVSTKVPLDTWTPTTYSPEVSEEWLPYQGWRDLYGMVYGYTPPIDANLEGENWYAYFLSPVDKKLPEDEIRMLSAEITQNKGFDALFITELYYHGVVKRTWVEEGWADIMDELTYNEDSQYLNSLHTNETMIYCGEYEDYGMFLDFLGATFDETLEEHRVEGVTTNPSNSRAVKSKRMPSKSKARKCGNCQKEGHNASQCVSENVPFSKGGFWREYKEGYRPIPDPKGRRTYKSQFGDGKMYQLRDYPFRFGYQNTKGATWNRHEIKQGRIERYDKGAFEPYELKERWWDNKKTNYAIFEYANYGYMSEGNHAGIMKSHENALIILSEFTVIFPLEAYSSKITEHETTTWGDLKKQLKGKSVKIGVMDYSVRTLKDAFKYLPLKTILRIRLWDDSGKQMIDDALLIITFVYDGEEWDFLLAPLRVEAV